ncbi:MAG: potassium/proton antiporter [Spongiibacteraceae bacterium]|jgi:cell volume regulation protein A|nr:potassium/proton antiporter [Spongiibacteraceae bacterium]
MSTTLLLIGAGLVMFSILLIPLSSRVGMPVLVLFIGVGMLAGEDGLGGIQFSDVNTAFMVANLALAIILLDGGMRTHVQSFRVGLRPALVLASYGVVVTAVVCGLFAMWLLDLPLLVGLLVGAIISSTDAAAVFSLLQGRGLRINERLEATLEIESGSNDPMAIFLTVMLIELIQSQAETQGSLWSGLTILVQQFGVGAVAGLAGGYVVAALANRVQLVVAMYPLLIAAAGITLFGITNALGGSGFLAIYLMGVVLASRKLRRLPSILQIHDGLAWLAQLSLFLLLGLLVSPSQLLGSVPTALLIAGVLTFVARPLATVTSLLPFGFSRREHIFIGWVGLRGAVPIVLALFPLMAGIPYSGMIFQITFVVVLTSLILQGATLAPLARWLKLEVPEAQATHTVVDLDHAAIEDHQLLLVPLSGERWLQPRPVTDIPLPEGAWTAALFRDGEMILPRPGVDAQHNDIVAVMAHRDLSADVDQILGSREPPVHLSDRRFFGDFTLNGTATLGDVRAAYGVSVSRFAPEMSLSECFAKARRGHPVVGDRIDLGNLMLVVRAVDGDRVTRVGLKLRKDP